MWRGRTQSLCWNRLLYDCFYKNKETDSNAHSLPVCGSLNTETAPGEGIGTRGSCQGKQGKARWKTLGARGVYFCHFMCGVQITMMGYSDEKKVTVVSSCLIIQCHTLRLWWSTGVSIWKSWRGWLFSNFLFLWTVYKKCKQIIKMYHVYTSELFAVLICGTNVCAKYIWWK